MKTLIAVLALALSLTVLTAADLPAPAAPSVPAPAGDTPDASETNVKKSRRGGANDIDAMIADAMKRAGDEVKKALEKTRMAGQFSGEAFRDAFAEVSDELARAHQYVQAIPVIPPVPAVAAEPGDSGIHRSSRYSSHSGSPPTCNLILVGKPLETKARAELEEDLDIMSRILEKKIYHEIGDSPDHALGILITGSGMENRTMQATYIDGFGVVFSANIRMPLLPPAKPDESKPKAATNSEWEVEKDALYGKSSKSGMTKRMHVDSMFSGAGAEYDAKKVDALEKSIVGALKNASHIRALGPDEFVTVAVSGGRPTYAVAVAFSGDDNTFEYSTPRGGGSARPSTLHIRAKKSDIDAFAADKLSFEDFRQKVSLNVY